MKAIAALRFCFHQYPAHQSTVLTQLA